MNLCEQHYQEIVPEEFWQLQTDDVIVERKKVERPFICGHLWEEPRRDVQHTFSPTAIIKRKHEV